MSEFRVASRYAKSLVDLSKEKGLLDTVKEDMKLLVHVCENNKAFADALRSPIISHDRKLAILKAVFQGKVNGLTMSIIEITSRKGRENILFSIAKEFLAQYNKMFNIEMATVYTASPLTSNLYEDFAQVVRKNTGKDVQIVTKIDPRIIGGYILRVGDLQIDESIKTMLQRLKTKFKDNPYEPKF